MGAHHILFFAAVLLTVKAHSSTCKARSVMGKSRVWLFHMQSSEWIDKGDDWLYRANTKIPKSAQEFNYTNISFDITHQEFMLQWTAPIVLLGTNEAELQQQLTWWGSAAKCM
jgi:hypothetical protein